MKQRCTNPNCEHYNNYGGRGIMYCERWETFDNFFEDMGHPPSGLTLERCDTNLGYNPSNCVWATRKEQSNNRRSNRIMTAFGKSQTLAQWADEYNYPYYQLLAGLRRNEGSLEELLTIGSKPFITDNLYRLRNGKYRYVKRRDGKEDRRESRSLRDVIAFAMDKDAPKPDPSVCIYRRPNGAYEFTRRSEGLPTEKRASKSLRRVIAMAMKKQPLDEPLDDPTD